MKKKTAWLISIGVSILLLIVLIILWRGLNKSDNEEAYSNDQYHEQDHMDKLLVKNHVGQSPQLVDGNAVKMYLDNMFNYDSIDKPQLIKTGIFVQSLMFRSSNEASLTGYLWQHHKTEISRTMQPDSSKVGVVFPEQVNTDYGIEPREVYRKKIGDEVVIGWYFETTLRQPLDYSKYPFDHQKVEVRMWPKNFSINVVLVPDLKAYESTEKDSVFGYEKSIIMDPWELENPYFNFRQSTYDTNFGHSNSDYNRTLKKDSISYPELHYNFLVKRKFKSAFIFYMLPIILCASLLFAALLTIGESNKVNNGLRSNSLGFLGVSPVLLLILMVTHVQLRRQFDGIGIVYLEYFYIVMYTMLVVAIANSYLFSISASWLKNSIRYKNNLILKVAYWPFLIGSFIMITLFFI